MDTDNKRESNVKLEPETIRAIEKDFAGTSSFVIQLDECNRQIAVLEEDKEGNKELLEQYYAYRDDILNKLKTEEDV